MGTFDYNKVKNPEYFKENRVEAHSDHKYYGSMEEMEQKQENFKYSLNGLWKFHYAKNYGSTVPGFEKESYCCKTWDDIRVPAHIQMEGYGVPQYANVQYPWEGWEEVKPGEIPTEFNPVASYVKYFEVPEAMKGKRVFISFQGAESGIALWLNGIFVGYSEDSFTPSEFELTEYLKEGENKLAAQVFKFTSSSWCEDQDFFRFSGIYREVYLYAVPNVHVSDLRLRAELDDTYTQGKLEILLKGTAAGKVKVTLAKNGETTANVEGELGEESRIVMQVQHPVLWSAEQPELYDILLEVYDEAGALSEVIPYRIGFRRFEMQGNIMTLNGKRIVFKGVNRHEFSSVSGRCVSKEELIQDIVTMKQNNINAIRTCHYPDTSDVYDLCDEYGLYMIAENNLETHGTWDAEELKEHPDLNKILPCDHPEWEAMMLDRVNSMYQRDKNHTAILIWSCGNESFGGKVIHEMSKFYKREDPTRLVHYEGLFHDRRYNDTSDMESQMYPSVESIKEFLAKDRTKPFICCEYTHAMGNSCGAMHKYTDLTDTEPLYQGGFIWDYIDQSIYKKDRYGKEYQAYGGDFDDRPCDYNFSGNGIAYGGDREASPKMQEVKFNYQNITALVEKDKVTVINKNLFINTDTFTCVAILEKDGKEVKRAYMETHTAPLSQDIYELPFLVQTIPGEYAVTVSFRLREDTLWAKAGHEVAFGQGIYQVEQPEVGHKGKLEVVRSIHNIGVKGDGFRVMFSYLNGGLVSYVYGGVEMIKAIPKPNFWRAPTDNDCGNLMQMRYGQWKLASMYASHKNPNGCVYAPELEVQEDCAIVTFTYCLPTIPASKCRLSYKVFGDATVETTLSYDPVKELSDMPEFGVIFKLDADYNKVTWYGMGPEETYTDRMKGAKLGIYENQVADNVARYMVPQECGNKTGVRWAKVTDRKGRGMLFAGDQMEFSALPWTPHEMENAAHPFELPEVHYTVVRVAAQQMGVGGDDSWGAKTHEEYLLDTKNKMKFTFSFKGI
ncbi:MAG: glycoside hydrolase family 2 TIM barrel-domain containing protein [Firmicutes bacterium]|nr:glycoside hydrolase family 2 TIM barrel-domain containing protein [Bacillota bacterium]